MVRLLNNPRIIKFLKAFPRKEWDHCIEILCLIGMQVAEIEAFPIDQLKLLDKSIQSMMSCKGVHSLTSSVKKTFQRSDENCVSSLKKKKSKKNLKYHRNFNPVVRDRRSVNKNKQINGAKSSIKDKKVTCQLNFHKSNHHNSWAIKASNSTQSNSTQMKSSIY